MELISVVRSTVEKCKEWDIPQRTNHMPSRFGTKKRSHTSNYCILARHEVGGISVRAWSVAYTPSMSSSGLAAGMELVTIGVQVAHGRLRRRSRKLWQDESKGLELDTDILQLFGWADDLYAFATDVDSMEEMVASIKTLAEAQIGFALRPDRGTGRRSADTTDETPPQKSRHFCSTRCRC